MNEVFPKDGGRGVKSKPAENNGAAVVVKRINGRAISLEPDVPNVLYLNLSGNGGVIFLSRLYNNITARLKTRRDKRKQLITKMKKYNLSK